MKRRSKSKEFCCCCCCCSCYFHSYVLKSPMVQRLIHFFFFSNDLIIEFCYSVKFLIKFHHCFTNKLFNKYESVIPVEALLTHSFPMQPLSTSWKHQKTVRFSDVFRGYKKGTFGTNGFKQERYFIKWLLLRGSFFSFLIVQGDLRVFRIY